MRIDDLLKGNHPEKWYTAAEVDKLLWVIVDRLVDDGQKGNWDGGEQLAQALVDAGINRPKVQT